MKVDKSALGLRISSIRKEKGLTLEEFGRKVLSAGKSNVSKWERGLTMPSNERLKVIAEMAGVTTDYLLYGDITDFLFSNFQELLPDSDKDLGKVLPISLIFDLSNQLKEEQVTITNLEQVKFALKNNIPYFKQVIEKEIDKQLSDINKNKNYKNEAIDFLAAEIEIEEFISTIKRIINKNRELTFEEKIEYAKEIEMLHGAFEMVAKKEIYFMDISTSTIKLSDLVKFDSKLDWNSEKLLIKEDLFIRMSSKPFPRKLKYRNLLVHIDFESKCDLLKRKPSVLTYVFENLNTKIIKKYFIETEIGIVFKNDFYIGTINNNLVFTTMNINSEKIELHIDDNFDFANLYPLACIYY